MKRYVKAAVSAGCAAALVLGTGVMASAEENENFKSSYGVRICSLQLDAATDENGAVPIADSSEYAYGYDVMMAQHICEELGYDLEIVKLDWDSLVPAVVSGTVDCVIAGQSITSERLEVVDFTVPYYYASIITLTKSDSEYAQAKGSGGSRRRYLHLSAEHGLYDVCLPQIEDANILPAQDSAPAMLVALDADKCDLVVTDMPTGMAAVVAYPDLTLLDFSGHRRMILKCLRKRSISESPCRREIQSFWTPINGVLEEMTPRTTKR